MTRHEAGAGDQIARVDWLGAEAQVRHSGRAGLLRVVNKVALRVKVRALTNDLDGVLVGPHRAVRAQSIKQSAYRLRRLGREVGIVVQAGVGNVVLDTNREMVFAGLFLELFKDALD